MNYRECIMKAKKEMAQRNLSENAPMLLMMEITGKENHDLYMEFEDEIAQDILEEFNTKYKRLLTGEPLQHILGYEYFYGYQFIVNEDVLIPRPETEELVANILAYYDEYFNGQKVDVCDIGTGSGAIAIALKKEEANFTMHASDISEKAIKVAKKNAQNLEANVNFLIGDMCEPLINQNIKVDILVSNPPYIPNNEEMEHSVKDFEPHVALFGGEDGLKFYRIIFERSKYLLKEKSFLAFEMGYNQKEKLTSLAKEYFPTSKIEVLKDMNGKNRMLFIFNNL
ncbi:MAG: peptide chain release factor N(5)-glutamine methyltransferase [Traorella sp.]